MSEMREALNLQREALHSLAQSREAARGWVDEQRRNFDTESLDPLAADGRALYEALRRASQEILAAQRMLQQ